MPPQVKYRNLTPQPPTPQATGPYSGTGATYQPNVNRLGQPPSNTGGRPVPRLTSPPPGAQPSVRSVIRARWNASLNSISQQKAPVNVPKPLPQFLANRQLIIAAWMVAMIVIGYDEWVNLGILPRPSRFWYSSVVYGTLAIIGMMDALVPIANALALGFTLMLIYQYFTEGGQFSAPPNAKNQNPLPGGTTGTTKNQGAGVVTA